MARLEAKYRRLPFSFLLDAISKPVILAFVKAALTECACQPVAAINSVIMAPDGRVTISIMIADFALPGSRFLFFGELLALPLVRIGFNRDLNDFDWATNVRPLGVALPKDRTGGGPAGSYATHNRPGPATLLSAAQSSPFLSMSRKNPLDTYLRLSVAGSTENLGCAMAEIKGLEEVRNEVDRISRLDLQQARVLYSKTFRKRPSKALIHGLLIRKLAWNIQEKAFGGHSPATLKILRAHSRPNAGKLSLFQVLQPGTVVVREYHGVRHTVTIKADGFAWQDQTYDSLSTIARKITGTQWNGPRFFGLRDAWRVKKEKA